MSLSKRLSPSMISLIIISCLSLAACNDQKKASPQGEMPIPVEDITVAAQPYQIKTELPARVTAYNIAEIRPQVSGIILKREFNEGGNINAGQSLYQIDPATYQAEYISSQAKLQSAIADGKIADLTLQRYQPLLKTKAISQQDYDTANANAQKAQANIKLAKAAVETAKINLNYTKVKSPISGIIGKSTVTAGALVNANQSVALTTVQQIDPIYIDISQPADDYLRFKQNLQSGSIKTDTSNIPVTIMLDNNRAYHLTGQLKFSDISVNESTGTISLRAEVPNPEHTLLPGMFVRAVITEGTQDNAILIPQKAISRDAQGNAYVMTIDKDNRVKTKTITIGTSVGSNWLVTSGVNIGDHIITSGLQKVRENALVTVDNPKESTAEQK